MFRTLDPGEFGVMGIASGAFHWSVSPWFVVLKQAVAGWLADHRSSWLEDRGACGCADFTALRGNPLDCGCLLDWRGKLCHALLGLAVTARRFQLACGAHSTMIASR